MQMNSLPSLFAAPPMPQPTPPSSPSSPSSQISLTASNQGVSTPSPNSPEANSSNAAAHPFAVMLKRQQVTEPIPATPAATPSKVDGPTTEPVAPADEAQPLANTPKLTNTSRSKRIEPSTWIKVEHPADTGKAASVASSDSKETREAKGTKDPSDVNNAAVVASPVQQQLQPEPVQCPIDLGLSAVAKRAGDAADLGKATKGIDAKDTQDTQPQAAAWGADARTSTGQTDTSVHADTDNVDASSAAARTVTRADVSSDKLEAVKHVALDDRAGRVDVPVAAPSFANTLAQLTGSSAAAAPVDVAVATQVNTPEFAQALGTQVSILVADGVQRAELHLNPADMGPVSIEITLNGTQAQVDFGADLASTRHAIEAGLPELASALQDAGFTLHGGGVSQHSARQSDGGEGRDDGSSGKGSRGAAAIGSSLAASGASAATARQRVAMTGGVDVYA